MLGDPVEVAHVHSLKFLIPGSQISSSSRADSEDCSILFKIEVTQSTQTLFLGSPDTIHNILDVEDKIRLAVASITEGHVRGVSLGDRRQSQMRRPGLDQNHVTCHEACCIGAATCIGLAVENHRPITVTRIAEDLMEENSEPIQMTDVERPEIGVEGVVQKGVVNREVHRRSPLGGGRGRLGPTFARRLGLIDRVWKWSSRAWSRVIRRQVQAVCGVFVVSTPPYAMDRNIGSNEPWMYSIIWPELASDDIFLATSCGCD